MNDQDVPDSIQGTYVEVLLDEWHLHTTSRTDVFHRGDKIILQLDRAKKFEAAGRCRILPEAEWPVEPR